jgi:hypothetical protein
MITHTIAAKEERDTKRRILRQTCSHLSPQFTQIGRIQSKGEGMFFRYKKIGLEGMVYEQNTGLENRFPDFI